MEGEHVSVFIFVIDFALLVAGLMAAYYTKQIGGGVGHKSLKIVTVAFIILAFAHLFESVTLVMFEEFFNAEPAIVEASHRVLVLISLVLIVYSYKKLAKFVRS